MTSSRNRGTMVHQTISPLIVQKYGGIKNLLYQVKIFHSNTQHTENFAESSLGVENMGKVSFEKMDARHNCQVKIYCAVQMAHRYG